MLIKTYCHLVCERSLKCLMFTCFFKDIDNNVYEWARLKRWKFNNCFKVEFKCKGFVFFFFLLRVSSYFCYPCVQINAKPLLSVCFGKEWGEENDCADLRNIAMVLAFWKFPAELLKSEVICDNGLFEWSVVLFELTVLIPTLPSWSLPANHHQPVRNPFIFTNLSALCVLIFIDFFDLEKKLTEALKA